MKHPAPKLDGFHALHQACGSIVDIKPDRRKAEGEFHAFHCWCPACGATSREVVNLDALDAWTDSTSSSLDTERSFEHAVLRARQMLLAEQRIENEQRSDDESNDLD